MLERDAHRHQTTPHRALSFCSQFFNSWLLWQVDHQRLEPRQALEAMVSQVRKECFGARASKGPPWEQVHEAIQGALSPGHIKLLDETVHFGADPFFLDTLQGEGEWNNNQEQDEKLTLALLKDQLVETTALRGLCFDYEADRIKGLLLKAGVRVSPIVTAIKKTPHGEPVLDEEGDPKRRVCIHCSFGENAPNRTMHSAEHTRQKTTAPELLVLKILQEEKRYPNHEIRFARDDMASAFKHIALRLRKVGLFATTVLCFVLISLTFIFGGKPYPGGFDPLGDAILKATLAMSRPEESWALNGEQHPECGRFVDDLFSIIAMTGNRCGDHLRRLREIVVAIMGEEGLNYEKQTEEGTPTCFKYAFGVVLDAVDRLVMSQWSKVVKLFNLTIDFVNGTTEGLNLGTIESVTGIARNVLFSCPGNGLARIVLPRLEAAIKDAHRQFPQPKHIHPPAWCMPKSRLRGEDEAQGQENLRRALNLLLRLAVIEKGKLLRCPYEMALAPEIRMTWPGKEKEDTLVFMQMDASKEGLYLIDLATGRYIQEEFTPEEQELFNAFERGEDAVTINHRELLSELFGVVLLGPKHAGKLINLVNDNTAAEHWTTKDRHGDAKVDQVLSLLGLSETLLRQTLFGSRVKTGDNFADFGTRKDKKEEYQRGIAELERKHGWKATKVEVPHWLRKMGWTQLKEQVIEGDWYAQAMQFVQWLEDEHSRLIESQCAVEGALIVEALKHAAWGARILEVPTPDGDFAPSTLSQARVWATQAVPLTPNQLQRSLYEFQKQFGDTVGAKEFCLHHGLPEYEDPQEAIWEHLESAYEEVFLTFAVDNKKFQPGQKRESPPSPMKLSLPPGCRIQGKKKLSSAFTGTGSVDTSMEDTGHIEVVSFCEQAPHLVNHLKVQHPKAEALERLTDFLEPQYKRHAHHHDASPPCPAHATANLYRRGNDDEFCGRHFEEQGKYIEHLEPLSAHIECNLGVLERQPGRKSPMETLESNLPSYYVTYHKVDAGRTASPATGRQAAMCHERIHVFCWRKSCFDKKPKVGHLVNKAKPVTSYEDRLDTPSEGQYYYTMPTEDQKAITYFTDVKASRHAVRIGEIYKPEPGRGHHLFPNGIEDPRVGPGSVDTAVSGSKWIPRYHGWSTIGLY